MRALAMLILLSACSRPGVVNDRPQIVEKLVTVPCITARPEKVPALRDRITRDDWRAKTPKQKSAEVGVQALRRQNYSDALEAATVACQ